MLPQGALVQVHPDDLRTEKKLAQDAMVMHLLRVAGICCWWYLSMPVCDVGICCWCPLGVK
jgi:hypothetical protein